MLRKYDFNRRTLYLNKWEEDQFLSVNTDYDIWGDNSAYSGLCMRTLAFYGILPINAGVNEDFNLERSRFIDYMHSKKNGNG